MQVRLPKFQGTQDVFAPLVSEYVVTRLPEIQMANQEKKLLIQKRNSNQFYNSNNNNISVVRGMQPVTSATSIATKQVLNNQQAMNPLNRSTQRMFSQKEPEQDSKLGVVELDHNLKDRIAQMTEGNKLHQEFNNKSRNSNHPTSISTQRNAKEDPVLDLTSFQEAHNKEQPTKVINNRPPRNKMKTIEKNFEDGRPRKASQQHQNISRLENHVSPLPKSLFQRNSKTIVKQEGDQPSSQVQPDAMLHQLQSQIERKSFKMDERSVNGKITQNLTSAEEEGRRQMEQLQRRYKVIEDKQRILLGNTIFEQRAANNNSTKPWVRVQPGVPLAEQNSHGALGVHLQKINTYLNRNQATLGSYMQNRELLLQLQLNSKISKNVQSQSRISQYS